MGAHRVSSPSTHSRLPHGFLCVHFLHWRDTAQVRGAGGHAPGRPAFLCSGSCKSSSWPPVLEVSRCRNPYLRSTVAPESKIVMGGWSQLRSCWLSGTLALFSFRVTSKQGLSM